MQVRRVPDVEKIFLFKCFKAHLPFFEPLTLIASPSDHAPAVHVCYDTAEITVFVSFHQIKICMCRRKRFEGLNAKEKKNHLHLQLNS